MLISIAPLSRIGYVPAGIVWATLKIIGLLAALGLLLRELARRGCAVPAGVLLITALFSFRPVIGDIQHGNLNLFMLLWIAFAWAFYLRGRDLLCGLFVALAVATKITPALLIIYFLYKKNWRVCIGATIGLALFFFVIPGLTLGFERNWQLLQSWYHMLVEPFARHGYVTREITNQSLHGVAVRLLSNAGWLSIEHMPPEMETVTGADKSVRPATQVGMLLKPALSLSVLAALAWICRPLRGKASLTDAPRLAERGAPRFGVELAAILLAMLLLSERTWKHHATTLPLVYLALWYAVACVPWTPRFRGLCVGLLGVQLAFLTLSTEGVVGEKIADHLQDGGFYCWGLVLALVQAGLMAGALRANRNQLDITSN